MNINKIDLENHIVENSTLFIRKCLYFIDDGKKSLCVSIFHYLIFIVGFIYFFILSNHGDKCRILVFVLVLLGLISYYTFNKCILTSIERKLYDKPNVIQNFIAKYFGEELEGNNSSKFTLLFLTFLLGFIIVCKDIRIKYKS